jgi:pimeloyl-ACP methyl ester carboxylesterase
MRDAPLRRGQRRPALAFASAMAEELAKRVLGEGPTVVLVHGGVGPELTWRTQEPLAERWRLVIPWRRGFAPSPPGRQDFLADADDLGALLDGLDGPAHAVGYSYGGLGLAIAAGRAPRRLRSLTLVELPIFSVAIDHPDVAPLARLSDAYTGDASGPSPDEATRAAFESFFGVPERTGDRDARAAIDRARALARGLRSPAQAQPDLDAVAAAGVPSLVVSGGHAAGLEAICDALAARLDARRERIEGAGHAVQRAEEFNDLLEAFLGRTAGTGP